MLKMNLDHALQRVRAFAHRWRLDTFLTIVLAAAVGLAGGEIIRLLMAPFDHRPPNLLPEVLECQQIADQCLDELEACRARQSTPTPAP